MFKENLYILYYNLSKFDFTFFVDIILLNYVVVSKLNIFNYYIK